MNRTSHHAAADALDTRPAFHQHELPAMFLADRGRPWRASGCDIAIPWAAAEVDESATDTVHEDVEPWAEDAEHDNALLRLVGAVALAIVALAAASTLVV